MTIGEPMRQIKTFILRLYIDLELRDKTCGNLQALPGRKTFPFKNKTELHNLLKQLSGDEIKNLPYKNLQIKNESNLSDLDQTIE
jgi:hypothetical protein